ncbi:RICIN domain-containing protein [Streptomyces sp. NPDC001406]|uniref:RICIN domain-containing protein n=2 Tax=unclassified Streptomyces TaxID=2593676 RepID=UPI0036A4A3C3
MNATDGYHLVITPTGTSTSLAGRYQITNKNSGLALDTANAGILYKIVNQKSGLVLGINNMSTADGGTALIWGDNGTTTSGRSSRPATASTRSPTTTAAASSASTG